MYLKLVSGYIFWDSVQTGSGAHKVLPSPPITWIPGAICQSERQKELVATKPRIFGYEI
jgi:hypothetical protein